MRSAGTLLLCLAAFALASCGDDQDPEGAKDLLVRIRDEGYTKWARAPGYEQRRETNAPHADLVDIFINDVVEDALAEEEGLDAWPVGSIVAKDGYDDDGTHAIVAVMEKRDDGWFWAEYDAETGESSYSGKPATCIDCHGSGSDFVRSFSLP
jgi:hypothetical protein